MMAPVQRAEGLAKKYGRPMFVYGNQRKQPRAPYLISDEDPGPEVWPLTIVHPDGHRERRPRPAS